MSMNHLKAGTRGANGFNDYFNIIEVNLFKSHHFCAHFIEQYPCCFLSVLKRIPTTVLPS